MLPTGASWVKPAVWLSSIRSVIFRSGCSSNALWTVKSGRYVVIGASRSSRPAATACMTAVAVNSFDIDWTLKIVSAVTGAEPPPSTLAEALDPQRPVPVDEGDGQAGDALLGHQLPGSVLGTSR